MAHYNYLTYNLLGQNGALGNQLWQIAGTFGEAERHSSKPRFPSWFYHPYFSVPDEWFKPVEEDSLSQDLGSDYLQGLHHWRGHERCIKNIFRPSELALELMLEVYHMNLVDFTAVHVRRGNNLTPQYAEHHPSPPLEYFERAIDGLPQKLDLWVFSDDLEWCKKQSIFKGAHFGQGPPKDLDVMELTKYGPRPIQEAAIDLLLMSECSQHVISNSSFSWWGAWLSRREVVSYPAIWYGEELTKKARPERMFEGLRWEKVAW